MNWNTPKNNRLIQAILALENGSEAKSFLRDLMTEKEINEFAGRLKAAEMLAEKTPYLVIEKETGLSSATVARVAKWLNGEEGGYKTVIDRLHHHDNSQSRRELS
ncbi:MAG: YerC/YecD family TrpR-related protein [Candidatus Saccharimonadales bacterium]